MHKSKISHLKKHLHLIICQLFAWKTFMKTNDSNKKKKHLLKTQLKLTTEDKPVTVTQFYFIRHTPLYQTGIIRYVSRAFLSLQILDCTSRIQ